MCMRLLRPAAWSPHPPSLAPQSLPHCCEFRPRPVWQPLPWPWLQLPSRLPQARLSLQDADPLRREATTPGCFRRTMGRGMFRKFPAQLPPRVTIRFRNTRRLNPPPPSVPSAAGDTYPSYPTSGGGVASTSPITLPIFPRDCWNSGYLAASLAENLLICSAAFLASE